MNLWKYKIKVTASFKCDLKKILKQGFDKTELDKAIDVIASGDKLDLRYKDHVLLKNKNFCNDRECHIKPDVLLIYYIDTENSILFLVRIGSHSDLFK